MLEEIKLVPQFNKKKQYEKVLRKKQLRLLELQRIFYKKGIPSIFIFEGWDAAGKGGVIRRITERLEPRGYVVHSIAAPDEHEKQYHYFRRFWKSLPKNGHLSIFDRSWYGRVLVERVEGFAVEEEWNRAYQEINAIEQMLVNDNYLMMKFWLNISKEEQYRRFEERKNNPFKTWKLTNEDWRNREKWDDYEIAVEEMIQKTSTKIAPWYLIDGNDKWTARVTVMDTIITQMEAILQSN